VCGGGTSVYQGGREGESIESAAKVVGNTDEVASNTVIVSCSSSTDDNEAENDTAEDETEENW